MIERCIGSRKTRQLHRFIRQSKVTFLCLLLTIIVLRGTIGAGKFGTPEQDFLQLRNRFSSRKFSSHYHHHRAAAAFNKSFLSATDDDGIIAAADANIKNWDQMRQDWLRSRGISVAGDEGEEKPRVMLVTGTSSQPCENPLGSYYLLKSIKNKVDYCRLHRIRVFYDMALLNAEMSGFGAKLAMIRSIIVGHPEVEFLWWMDSDAMFTDMAFEVPWERYKGYNLVVHGSNKAVYEEKSVVRLSTESFLIRNCQWSLDLIQEWGRIVGEAGELFSREVKAKDESALVYLLSKERDSWGGRVYLENEYYLQGFREIVESGFGDQRWPLVTHFVGCKPCAKDGDYPVETCLKQMERAFNFGDNQVLQMYGFAHKSLSSTSVKRVENDTSNQRAVSGGMAIRSS